MSKTAKEIQGDVIDLLKSSEIATNISGGIYRNGFRPTNSKLEDIVVTHTAGTANQLQSGVITINAFVQDLSVTLSGSAQLVENGERLEELELLFQDWADEISLNNVYTFELKEIIKTDKDKDLDQHFVVVKLNYYFFNI